MNVTIYGVGVVLFLHQVLMTSRYVVRTSDNDKADSLGDKKEGQEPLETEGRCRNGGVVDSGAIIG